MSGLPESAHSEAGLMNTHTHTHLKTSHWPAKDGNSSFLRTAPACEEDVEDGQTSNFGLPETTCNPMRRRRKENKNSSDRSIPSSKPAQTKRSSSRHPPQAFRKSHVQRQAPNPAATLPKVDYGLGEQSEGVCAPTCTPATSTLLAL